MNSQSLIVALIVLACAVYAVWSLMPSTARRSIAVRVLRLSLPRALASPFRKAIDSGSGCGGCGSCGGTAGSTKPVTFHSRPGR